MLWKIEYSMQKRFINSWQVFCQALFGLWGHYIYDQPDNESSCNKLGTVQYNSALATIEPIRGTSKAKLYQQLGLKLLKSRRWFRCSCCLHKIKTFGFPPYVSNLVSSSVCSYNTQNLEDMAIYHPRTETFKYSFYSWTTFEWSKFDFTLCKSSYKILRNYLLKMIFPSPNLLYDIHYPLGLFGYKIKTETKSFKCAQM